MKVKREHLKRLLVAEAELVDEAVRRAVEHALLTHKRAGRPVVSWEDGEVVIIPPEKIPGAAPG